MAKTGKHAKPKATVTRPRSPAGERRVREPVQVLALRDRFFARPEHVLRDALDDVHVARDLVARDRLLLNGFRRVLDDADQRLQVAQRARDEARARLDLVRAGLHRLHGGGRLLLDRRDQVALAGDLLRRGVLGVGGVPQVERLSLRVVTDAYHHAFERSGKVGEVGVERFVRWYVDYYKTG